MENNVTILRIDFDYSQTGKEQSFWKHLWSSTLSNVFFKKSNIKQSNLFTAKSGCLNYETIKIYNSELLSSINPMCLELIDNDKNIKMFIQQSKELLESAIIVLVNPNSKLQNIKC
ncbi:DUF190 domain-containing protein [Flavobacterium sp. LB2P53]|uniref:DUF190 domain-containing protein n=1 Tax=Flavobacterium sp. LB2P53 TaxID=2497481 RepID=UPI000F83BD9B|nr:DUF190 domain-containing protein [Flavobacterium sp. LB2P53]RTY67090.1 hypothetical protein EKL95_09935 [Flavobacterium sp. LB2P53]